MGMGVRGFACVYVCICVGGWVGECAWVCVHVCACWRVCARCGYVSILHRGCACVWAGVYVYVYTRVMSKYRCCTAFPKFAHPHTRIHTQNTHEHCPGRGSFPRRYPGRGEGAHVRGHGAQPGKVRRDRESRRGSMFLLYLVWPFCAAIKSTVRFLFVFFVFLGRLPLLKNDAIS